MIAGIDEFRKYIGIVGFRNIHIANVDDFLKRIDNTITQNVETQFFNAEVIATWEHVYFAVLDGLVAFKNKENIADSVAMETMLYVSAQHQIKLAMQTVGLKRGTSDIVFLAIGNSAEMVAETIEEISRFLKSEPNNAALDLTPQKRRTIMKFFGISRLELKTAKIRNAGEKGALINLVVERMALFAARR